MALASSAISIRLSLKRNAAPEKVNATSKPNRAKTAVDGAETLLLRIVQSAPDRETTAGFQQDQHAHKEQNRKHYWRDRRFHEEVLLSPKFWRGHTGLLTCLGGCSRRVHAPHSPRRRSGRKYPAESDRGSVLQLSPSPLAHRTPSPPLQSTVPAASKR
jgi:hypothetical protein